MSPTLGSQEKLNRNWLISLGAGIDQQNPKYTNEWLFDLLKSGGLAQAAINGYLKIPQDSADYIKNVVLKNKFIDNKNISL